MTSSLLKNVSRPFYLGLSLFVAGLIAGACVTVNVNFPEATVQKAAGDYVEELYKAKDRSKDSDPSPAKPTSQIDWQGLTDFLIPSAHAVDITATFQVKSAKTSQIQSRQAGRLEKVIEAKKAGHIGEGSNGYLSFDHDPQLKPLLKKSLQPVVDAENQDRKELYSEILSLNHMSSSNLKSIETSFARSFQSASPAGTWVQSAEGKWSQK